MSKHNPWIGLHGDTYINFKSMCQAYQVSPNKAWYRLLNGADKTEYLDPNITGFARYTDHKGNAYSSITEMCAAYHVKISTFDNRRNHGWNLQDCLEGRNYRTPRKPGAKTYTGKKCEDHTGKQYESTKAMCNAYGIYPATFCKRMSRGATLEEALTKPVRKYK